MSNLWLRLSLLLLIISLTPQESDAQSKQWCIAKYNTPENQLQKLLDWACGQGADCSAIQPNKPCFTPNSVTAHASYAFNAYFQKFKHSGGACNFNGAAYIVTVDPSYQSCIYPYIP